MKKLFIQIGIVMFCLFFVSCKKLVTNLNEDPNNPTDAPVNLILTGAQVADMQFHGSRIAIISNLWAGYMTGIQRQFLSYQNYQYTSVETEDAWQFVYNSIYVQLKVAIDKYKPLKNDLGIGIAKIVQAHALGTATALYGDIPFTQAGNPKDFPNPAFDPQLQVYAGIQSLLDEGIASIETGIGSLPDKTDIFFNGNRTRWLQVAHTLKARYYTETKEYAKAYAEASKGISNMGNSMLSPNTITAGTRNEFYQHNVESRAGDVNSKNAYLTKILDPASATYRGNAKTNERARFNYYFVNLGSGGITGDIEPNYLSLGRGNNFNGIIGMEMDAPLVTYQENLLILAESAARTKDFATTLNHLNLFRNFMNGGGYIDPTYVSAYPVVYQPYTEQDFENGGINNPAGLTKAQALLQEILEERYVTFFTQIIGFNDVRRTRKEMEGVKLSPTIGTKLPERFFYGQREISSNTNIPTPLPDLFEPTPVNK